MEDDLSRLRLYADTSVIGGCLDEEFSEESLRLLELVRRREVVLLVSDVVIAELQDAPEAVRELLLALPPEAVENVPLTPEVQVLRDAYLAAHVLSPRWIDDATHVAAATVAKADAIVSWNFRHIVRLDKMRAYNEVNGQHGYSDLTIITPAQVSSDGPEDGEDV